MSAEAYIAEIGEGDDRRRLQIFRLDEGDWMLVVDQYDATESAAPIFDAIETDFDAILKHVADHAPDGAQWRTADRGKPVDLANLA